MRSLTNLSDSKSSYIQNNIEKKNSSYVHAPILTTSFSNSKTLMSSSLVSAILDSKREKISKYIKVIPETCSEDENDSIIYENSKESDDEKIIELVKSIKLALKNVKFKLLKNFLVTIYILKDLEKISFEINVPFAFFNHIVRGSIVLASVGCQNEEGGLKYLNQFLKNYGVNCDNTTQIEEVLLKVCNKYQIPGISN